MITHQEKENQILAMISQEFNVYTMNELFEMTDTHQIWRRKICEWSYRVVDHFHLDRDVVSLSLNYIDRYLEQLYEEFEATSDDDKKISSRRVGPEEIDGKTFQLIATTALYIAIKIHGEKIENSIISVSQRLTIKTFVSLSRGLFKISDIQSMEIKILSKLKWRVNPPTAAKIASYLLRLLPNRRYPQHDHNQNETYVKCDDIQKNTWVDDRVVHVLIELSRYLAEVSAYVYSLSLRHKPSVVAFATIIISSNLMNSTAFPNSIRYAFFAHIGQLIQCHYNSVDVIEVVKKIQDICPDITRCDMSLFTSDSRDHPILIAKEAGFLAKSVITQDGSNKKNAPHIHSPCSVVTNQ